MKPHLYAALAAASVLALTHGTPSSAQTQQKREPIYGYRMMSEQERNDYREKMRSAATAQDRQALRDEHRKLMQNRMAEQVMQGGPGRGMGPHGQGGGEMRGPAAGMGGPGGPGMRGPRANGPSTPPAAPGKAPDTPGKAPDAQG